MCGKKCRNRHLGCLFANVHSCSFAIMLRTTLVYFCNSNFINGWKTRFCSNLFSFLTKKMSDSRIQIFSRVEIFSHDFSRGRNVKTTFRFSIKTKKTFFSFKIVEFFFAQIIIGKLTNHQLSSNFAKLKKDKN